MLPLPVAVSASQVALPCSTARHLYRLPLSRSTSHATSSLEVSTAINRVPAANMRVDSRMDAANYQRANDRRKPRVGTFEIATSLIFALPSSLIEHWISSPSFCFSWLLTSSQPSSLILWRFFSRRFFFFFCFFFRTYFLRSLFFLFFFLFFFFSGFSPIVSFPVFSFFHHPPAPPYCS